MITGTLARLTTSKLPLLLGTVREGKVSFGGDDIYRLCVLLQGAEDPLCLRDDKQFMGSIAHQFESLCDPQKAALGEGAGTKVDAVNAFQKSLIERVLTPHMKLACISGEGDAAQRSGSLVESSAKKTSSKMREPSAVERVNAIWEITNEVLKASSSSDSSSSQAHGAGIGIDQMQTIGQHMCALELQLRNLTPIEVSRLVKALACVNYKAYQHTSLLSRRSCEIASQLPSGEICRLYFNLHKLNTHDSLHAIVNQIMLNIEKLSAEEVYLIAQSLERQHNTTPAAARMLPLLAEQAVKQMRQATASGYHRAVLNALSRYGLREHAAIARLLHDLHRFRKTLSERDVPAILQAMVNLRVPASTGCYQILLSRAAVLVKSGLEIRAIDSFMDTLSVLPVDSTAVMAGVMARLDCDAGRLTIPQLATVLNLLSTYPPAKGHVCVVSLSFTAVLRAGSIDASCMEGILISLSRLQHFTDDFFNLLGVLQSSMGGFHQISNFLTVLESLTKDVVMREERAQRLITRALSVLAPQMNEEEERHCKKILIKLGFDAQSFHLYWSAKPKSTASVKKAGWFSEPDHSLHGQHKGKRSQRKPYDPMEGLIL